MSTSRKVVSDVLTEVKAQTLDDRISRRLVLSRLLDKTRKFIKQDSDNRRLLKISEGWKPLKCIELCEASPVDCNTEAVVCDSLMKSKKKLPKSFQTSYGNMLKIFTIDKRKELKQTTFGEYKEIRRREWKNPNVIYFILLEDHIFVPDQEIEQLTGFILCKSPHEVDKFNCEESECSSPLDAEFPCPDYLQDLVIQETVLELAKIYRGIQEDSRPNDNQNQKQ